MDFNDGKNCVIEKCLRNLYKGLWEVLMFFILDYFGFFFCNFVDGCINLLVIVNDIFNFLWKEFI